MSSLAQRVVVALLLGPFLLALAYFGGVIYFVPLSVLLLVAASEFTMIAQNLGRRVPAWLLLSCVAGLLLAGQVPALGLSGPILLISLLAIVIFAIRENELRAAEDPALDWFALVAGVMLIGWLGGHFFLLRGLSPNGWQWTALTFLAIWAADGAAFLVGRFLAGNIIGRHYISPVSSPKKTVEGYVGGIIAAVGVSLATAWFFGLSLYVAFAVGLLVSTFGLAGDLGISLLKREAGVKDSGRLLPGHGGVLDRFDSMIWSMAIAYYVIIFTEKYL